MEQEKDIKAIAREVKEYSKVMPKIKNLVISDNLRNLINQEIDLLLNRTYNVSGEITSNIMNLCKDKESYLVELEHCYKSRERIFEKVYNFVNEDLSVFEAIDKIEDSLRFTYIIINSNDYINKVNEYIDKLESFGYHVYEVLNCWGDEYYQGLNIIFEYERVKFEVQFHTINSFHIKEGYTREPYMVIRNNLSNQEMIDKANIVRKYYQKQVIAPDGATSFQYKKNR